MATPEGWNDRFGPKFLHAVFFMYMTGNLVLSEVGAFFQKCCTYSIFGMLFFPLQTRNLSSMPEMLYIQDQNSICLSLLHNCEYFGENIGKYCSITCQNEEGRGDQGPFGIFPKKIHFVYGEDFPNLIFSELIFHLDLGGSFCGFYPGLTYYHCFLILST